MLRFGASIRKEIFNTIKAILFLGNVQFVESSGNQSSVDPNSESALALAAELLFRNRHNVSDSKVKSSDESTDRTERLRKLLWYL